MSRSRNNSLSLANLWRLFPEVRMGPAPSARVVKPRRIPEPERSLLVHREHMTEALKQRYGTPVKLNVLDRRREGRRYSRRLLLTLRGARWPVLFGIMRIDLAAAPSGAREAILAEKRPLGAILIEHQVLRRIEPVKYLEIEPTRALARALMATAARPVYGRLAVIHCGGLPAIELLEVVAP